MSILNVGFVKSVISTTAKGVQDGTHMKVFKDGTVARLVDFTENGVKKSRLTIFPKNEACFVPVDRLTTYGREAGHTMRTKHIVNQNLGYGEGFVGEAYTEGAYKTIDRFYDTNGNFTHKIEGFTTPKYEKEIGTTYSFNIEGVPQKNVPWYLQNTQHADMNTDGTLRSLAEGPAGMRYVQLAITPEVKQEYSILEDIVKRPLNLLNRVFDK